MLLMKIGFDDHENLGIDNKFIALGRMAFETLTKV